MIKYLKELFKKLLEAKGINIFYLTVARIVFRELFRFFFDDVYKDDKAFSKKQKNLLEDIGYIRYYYRWAKYVMHCTTVALERYFPSKTYSNTLQCDYDMYTDTLKERKSILDIPRYETVEKISMMFNPEYYIDLATECEIVNGKPRLWFNYDTIADLI